MIFTRFMPTWLTDCSSLFLSLFLSLCVCAFQPLAAGDSAEVRYTGWLEAGGAEGNVFDSNMKKEKALRFRIGKGKVIRGTSTQRPLTSIR
jgi:hypothetical protein